YLGRCDRTNRQLAGLALDQPCPCLAVSYYYWSGCTGYYPAGTRALAATSRAAAARLQSAHMATDSRARASLITGSFSVFCSSNLSGLVHRQPVFLAGTVHGAGSGRRQ